MIELDFQQIEQVQKDLKLLSQELQDKAIRSGLVFAASPIKKTMAAEAPQKRGDLSRSITHRQITKRQAGKLEPDLRQQLISSESGIAIVVGPNKRVNGRRHAYKARLVEEGTDAHVISPKSKNKNGLLRWLKGSWGNWFYYKGSVNHPGTKPDPFMYRALQHNESQLTPRFYQGLTKRLDKLKAQ